MCRKAMKAQSGLKFPSEPYFGIINTTKDLYLLNSKVAFLKRGQNVAGICPFFYGAGAVISGNAVECQANGTLRSRV